MVSCVKTGQLALCLKMAIKRIWALLIGIFIANSTAKIVASLGKNPAKLFCGSICGSCHSIKVLIQFRIILSRYMQKLSKKVE